LTKIKVKGLAGVFFLGFTDQEFPPSRGNTAREDTVA